MSPINFHYLHSFSVKLQHVPIIHTTMALQFTVNPAQQTRAIVSLEAGVYLIVSVSKDMKAVQRVVTPVQVRKTFFSPHSHVIFRMFLKTEVFYPSQLAFCPYVNGVFGRRKRWFSFTIPREEIFENAGFSVFLSSFGRTKTVIRHILLALRILLKGCYRKSVILAFSCGRAKKLDI